MQVTDIRTTKTAGNIPLGIKKGLALVSNNNAWADPGASDPNKVQGDLLAEADGIITIQYSGQAYNETSTMNEANFWAVKVAPDGSLTEVPNSRYSTTIEANRKIAKTFSLKVYHSQFSRASQLDFWLIQILMMAFICKAEQTENLCLRLL